MTYTDADRIAALRSGVYYGNALNLLRRLPPESVDLLLTDPPYNTSKANNFHTMGRTGINFSWDGGFDQVTWLQLADPALKPGANVVIWNDWKNLGLIAAALEQLGYDIKRDICWRKCLSGATRIYAWTQKGAAPSTLKDLVKLDPETVRLWTGERWSRVLGWSENAKPENPLEIHLRSGEVLKSTGNHRWPTQRGVVDAVNLRAGDVIATTALPQPVNLFGPPVGLDDEVVGWFVGAYIANGSRGGHKGNPKLQISGAIKHKERQAKLEQMAHDYDGTCRVHLTGGQSAEVHLTGRVLNGIIDQYVSGHDCYTKHLKTRCWRRNNAFLRAVLLGYLEGDGHYDRKNDRYRLGFTRKNKRLAADLRTLCARLRLQFRLKHAHSTLNGVRFPTWRGEIRLSPSDRTKEDSEIVETRPCRWAGRFWDVEIEDEPHLFALASGVLTHNSNPMPRNIKRSMVQRNEHGFWAVKRGAKWTFNPSPDRKYEDGVYGYPTPRAPAGRLRHEAKKPDGMFREIIRLLSDPRDVVLDPFVGGGTTAFASASEGRRYIAFEMSLKWFNEAKIHLMGAPTPSVVDQLAQLSG